jgi:hypothetical protein
MRYLVYGLVMRKNIKAVLDKPETKAKMRAAKLGDLNPAKRPEVRAKMGRKQT